MFRTTVRWPSWTRRSVRSLVASGGSLCANESSTKKTSPRSGRYLSPAPQAAHSHLSSPRKVTALDRVHRGSLPRHLLRFLHQPREFMQLDTVQIGYGPISHA